MVIFPASILSSISNISSISGFFHLVGSFLSTIWDSVRAIFDYIPTLIQLPFTLFNYVPGILVTAMIICIGVAVFRVVVELL